MNLTGLLFIIFHFHGKQGYTMLLIGCIFIVLPLVYCLSRPFQDALLPKAALITILGMLVLGGFFNLDCV